MAEKKPDPKQLPPNKGGTTDVGPGGGGGGGGVGGGGGGGGPGGAGGGGNGTDTEKLTKKEKQLKQQAQQIASNYKENNRGGAPVDPAFVLAALQQGLSPKEIRMILNSQALGGPQTTESYSSTELLDYYTEHPELIRNLVTAATTYGDAPESYAEYLASGGTPGEYRSRNQILQEAVLADPGAREAYLAGTSRAKYIAEGNDPRRWSMDMADYLNGGEKPPATATGGGQSFIGGFDVPDTNALDGYTMGDAVSMMLQAHRNRQAAQGDVFSTEELQGETL